MARMVVVLALVLIAGRLSPVAAAARVQLQIAVDQGGSPALTVTGTNAGDAAVAQARPEVVFQQRTIAADPVDLPAGARHEWHVALGALPGRGTFAAVVHLEPVAAAPSPLVVLATAPGSPPATVETTLVVEPIRGTGRARIEVENRGPDPVAGRVVVILPRGLVTEPESQPVAVAAGTRTVVPFTIEDRGSDALADLAVTILYEYTHDGVRQTVLARAPLGVTAAGMRTRAVPLAVGGVAMLLAFVVLGVALRAGARRARVDAPLPRPARRT